MNKMPSSFNAVSDDDESKRPMYDIRDFPQTHEHPITPDNPKDRPMNRNHRKRIIDEIIKRQPN